MASYYEAIPQIAALIQGRGLARERFVTKLRGPIGTDDSVSAREQSHTDISGRKRLPVAAGIELVVSHRLHLWLHFTIGGICAQYWQYRGKCFPKADFGFDRVQALAGIMRPRQREGDAETDIANANAIACNLT
jgi:hypothetical protein